MAPGNPSRPSGPTPLIDVSGDSQQQQGIASSSAVGKKKKHRGGKKRRNRRQSFAATADMAADSNDDRPTLEDIAGHGNSRGSTSFYGLSRNLSNTSLESEALLDHRDHQPARTRRQSIPASSMYAPRASQQFNASPGRLNVPSSYGKAKLSDTPEGHHSDHDDADDRTPLMMGSPRDNRKGNSYGTSAGGMAPKKRRPSTGSGKQRPAMFGHPSQSNINEGYDVNNPPSVPASPVFEANPGLDDVALPIDLEHSSESRSRDALIDIDGSGGDSGSQSPKQGDFHRRMTQSFAADDDVCFPHEGMSEIGQQDYLNDATGEPTSRRRRRRWPDLDVLATWSNDEKEQRTMEGIRLRKVSEPLMVDGRLRPRQRQWHREADDAPFRFTYFNETFDNTIHSQTISELLQPGQSWRDLFIPEPVELDDSSDDDSDVEDTPRTHTNGTSRTATLSPSRTNDKTSSGEQTRTSTPRPQADSKATDDKQKRYGPRPAWWLDVMSPTETEMKVISKTFGIHPLTSEDILMQEQREKVELFKHYYFINYRTFEQDQNSEDYLEPVNLYIVVFREGVISFHFSMTPHPANVRRRIRQLSDYLVLSPDWISYAMIDDITDAYAPMIQSIEEEVDDIDEAILRLHNANDDDASDSDEYDEKQSKEKSGRDMLRRVGECRKKVMSLYRLLGNKADVIKGFAKRCNEHWDIAPRNEIGMYLGDIQDHIVTMTGNLSHYENLLSRAHSNYLAQINIRMNERQEQTSDILGKLTVLGTIVLPMNVVTGIWGMNCIVPGQDVDNLNWFFGITGGLVGFGLLCYMIAKRVYGIV
ncbi:CorA metal ion transporter [Didymella glomerata]|uniref:CorA metal ion transporter n=1 Tax=Didymella glomerata TaxID=749621 RepID=A0A9W8WWD1_9PLEO|nr:CorA metal ion transporter [Didymella glomerata]